MSSTSRRDVARIVLGAALAIIAWLAVATYVARHRFETAATALLAEHRRNSVAEVESVARHIERSLTSLRGIPAVLEQMHRLKRLSRKFDARASSALPNAEVKKRRWTADRDLDDLNRVFRSAARNFQVDAVYALNEIGDCIVASNADTPESFVGANYADREYFRLVQQGMQVGYQYAVGRITKTPGLYYSAPIRVDGQFAGAVVVKVDVKNLSHWVDQIDGFVVDDFGVVIMSKIKRWELHQLAGAPQRTPGELLSRYRTAVIPRLAIDPVPNSGIEGFVRIDNETAPYVLSSIRLKDDPVTAYSVHSLSGLAVLEAERVEHLILLAVLGSLVVVVIAGTLYYILQTRVAAAELLSMNLSLSRRVEEETQRSLQKERVLMEQARHAAMGEMIGNIAHQWRQPLAALSLVMQNLRWDYKDGRLDEAALENYAGKSLQLIDQMTATIEDFQNFFKPNREREWFDVGQGIEECVGLVNASLKAHGIIVGVDTAENLRMFGYPNELSQVVLNLISNAKDALVERGVENGWIVVTAAADQNEIVVSVRDNAGGISAKDMDRIYDPYFTTKEKGTGIGLYMTRTIIEQHMGGTITAENTEDGVQFTITVPVDPQAATAIQMAEFATAAMDSGTWTSAS